MTYVCPVCGYAKLKYPPTDYTICPCCGTEFGYKDFAMTHEELRNQWIASGAHWDSQRISPPTDWDPFEQLTQAGYSQPVLTTHK